MAVAYRAGATANNGQSSNTSTAAVTIPAGAQIGDTALFCMVQNSGSSTFTAPAGWTLMRGPDTVASNLRTAVWKKDLVSGEPGSAVNFTSNVGARLPGAMLVFSGTSASAVTIIEMQPNATASTTISSPPIATTVADSMIAAFWALRDPTGVPSPDVTVPGTHTARAVAKTAFAVSPNFTVQSSHRTATVALGTYGGGPAATASEPSTAIVYYIALPPSLGAVPTASFTATPTTGTAPLSVTFTDTSTGSPSSWAWNFGDGDTSTSQNPSHTYASAGTYTVSMTATNATGSDAASTATITVSAAASTGAGMQLYSLQSGAFVALTPYSLTP